MNKVLRISGVALIVLGGVWTFQGIGTLKGSVMTGSSFWGWTGVVTAGAGVVLVALGMRKPSGGSDDN